jgi:hypothetical protein
MLDIGTLWEYSVYCVRMDIDLEHKDQGWNSIPFTGSGWILTLSTKTRDAFLTRSGWVLTLGPVILCVVPDRDGYHQVL